MVCVFFKYQTNNAIVNKIRRILFLKTMNKEEGLFHYNSWLLTRQINTGFYSPRNTEIVICSVHAGIRLSILVLKPKWLVSTQFSKPSDANSVLWLFTICTDPTFRPSTMRHPQCTQSGWDRLTYPSSNGMWQLYIQ